jgi:hypothetical protein
MPKRFRLLFWLLPVAAAGLAVYLVSSHDAARGASRSAGAETARSSGEAPAATPPAPEPAPTRVDRGGTRPTTASADALALDEMHDLVDQNRISAARAAAERFFEMYPESPYGERVERLTGVHPKPPRPGL